MAVPTTEVSGVATAIDGLLVFEVTRVEDDRGWFQEKFHRDKLVAAGLSPDFTVVQTSIAFNREGSTRGIHAEPWDKYVSLVDGKAFAAYVDLRPGLGFGTVVSVELSPTTAVFVPAGVGNSYQCLTDLHYIYSVNEHWTAEAYDKYTFVNLADSQLAINWPIPLPSAILSEKDKTHPPLRAAPGIP
jgi:dTDP-4-dehydrorhamnose 3,5-epimerase